MKKNYFPFLLFLLFYLIVMLTQKSTDHINGKIIIADKELIESNFNGEVIAVDLRRGFKIEIKNHKYYAYNPSNYCNASTCLAGFLEIGDTLYKHSNSDTIYQIKKSNHKKYTWVLTN
ncbi:MAG: hypothetical protein ORN53_05255 [Crocinitomicaceae bacterium]|nr:hypothetical protein [Crocinitomicaceae bacterium]